MGSVVVLAVALAACAAVALAVVRRNARPVATSRWPVLARKPLSAPEQVLYFRLMNALPGHMVLAKVALSRVLRVDPGLNKQQALAWHQRINRMTVDFVICTRDASVLAVIELDDATHERADRREADEKKERALEAAGIHVIRWRAKLMPDEAAIRRAFPRTSRTSRSSGHLARAA